MSLPNLSTGLPTVFQQLSLRSHGAKRAYTYVNLFHTPFPNMDYVEAQLSRSAAGGQAGLAGFAIKKIVP